MPRAWVTSDAYGAMVEVLVRARQDAGLSQRELAAQLGKPRSFVSKVETKERRVDLLEFIDVAKALHIPPAQLFEAVLDAVGK